MPIPAGAARIGTDCADACLSAAEALPQNAGSYEPGLVVAADGRQHLIYSGAFSNIYYQTRLPGGAWSAALDLGAARTASLAVDSLGTLHVALLNNQSQIVYHSRSSAGVWSSPQTLYTADWAPKLLIDANNRLFLFFTCGGRLGCPNAVGIYLRVLTPGQGWGPLRSLALRNASIFSAPDGRIFISWVEPTIGWFIARLGPDGSLSDSAQILTMYEQYGSLAPPAIAIGLDGIIHVAWIRDANSFYYAACLPGELCGEPMTLAGASGSIALRSDAQGVLHLLTQPSSTSSSYGIQYRRMSYGGAWSQPTTLSSASFPEGMMSLDPQGRAQVVAQGSYWHTQDAAASGTSQIAQTVSIPAGMHAPTLAFAYSAGGLGPGGASRVTVSVSAGGGPASEVFSRAVSSPWQTAWVDMSAYAGQTVTVSFGVEQAASDALVTLTLDDVSLGSWRTPVINSVEPADLVGSGATTLTIHGDNFIGTPQVLLGQTTLTGVKVIDAQTLQATLPAGLRPGATQLRVVNPGGQRSALAVSVGHTLMLPLLRR